MSSEVVSQLINVDQPTYLKVRTLVTLRRGNRRAQNRKIYAEAVQGDPLTDPLSRDYRRYLQVEKDMTALTVNRSALRGSRSASQAGGQP